LSATSRFEVSVKGVGNLLALKPAFTIDMRSAESNQVGCGMRACTRKINLADGECITISQVEWLKVKPMLDKVQRATQRQLSAK